MNLLKYELKELVARDLSIALKRIKETIKHDSNLYNELIMLEGRFLDTINYFNLNLTEKSLIDIEKSKIRRSILEIIDNLNENNILSESLELSWWNELPFEWEQAFEYIIGNNPTEKKVKYLFIR
jgi:hypothetical protein